MIRGFLETTDRYQAHGWCVDEAAPDRHVEVEFTLGPRQLGRTTADIFRLDLQQNSIGGGDHAFTFTFPQPLEAEQAQNVRARVMIGENAVTLPRLPAEPRPAPPAPTPSLRFGADAVDETQRPVFVLGAARSGTSAMVGALLRLERYAGQAEGHILDLLAHLSLATSRFYSLKHDDAQPGRNTMIAQVPEDYVQAGLDHIFVDLARQMFATPHWVEKTPNSDLVHLAPRFLQIWPNARFIFMRRRSLENIASRSRKFHYDYARNCQEWGNAMKAWASVRDKLAGSAIELDQMILSHQPERVATALTDFLTLDPIDTRVIAESLRHERPQRTATTMDDVLDLESQGLSAEQLAVFNKICKPWMDLFGYTTDSQYHRDGIEASGLVLV